MSQDIKLGDMVMVVRGTPCCGFLGQLKYLQVATVVSVDHLDFVCRSCMTPLGERAGVVFDTGLGALASMVKKIDPPADGDSLPTRKDLEVPV